MNDPSRTNEFLRLFMANHKRIYAFILGMVANYQDAEDIFQQTTLIMWSKFDHYVRGTSFASWGATVAKYEILNARRRKTMRSTGFGPEVQELVEKRSASLVHQIDARMEVLRECVRKLDPRDYTLVQMRYDRELDVQTIADRLGRSAQSVYKRLARIHDVLLHCIRRGLHREELA